MKEKKVKYVFLPFIPTGKNAITIYPFIFWSKKKKTWLRPNIIVHEMYHWNEQKNWKETKTFGLGRWFLKYISLWFYSSVLLGRSNKEHPMEKAAYDAQRNFLK